MKFVEEHRISYTAHYAPDEGKDYRIIAGAFSNNNVEWVGQFAAYRRYTVLEEYYAGAQKKQRVVEKEDLVSKTDFETTDIEEMKTKLFNAFEDFKVEYE